jgi:hypothetical protein
MNGNRRIFYDKLTGDKIHEIGRNGSFTLPTIEQDIATFTALSERNRDTFDVLELEFGKHHFEFSQATSYRVNPTTKELEFNYDPLFSIEDYRQFKKDEMFKHYEDELLNGFSSSLVDTSGSAYHFLYDKDSQMKINGQTNKLNLMLSRLSLGQLTQVQFDAYFPIQWRTANLGIVGLTYGDYLVFADEVEQHERKLLTKRLQKEGLIDTLTTKEEIEAVVW